MILDTEVLVKVNKRNYKVLHEKGYNVKLNDVILINPLDYPLKKSNFSLKVKCDVCGFIKTIKWDNYVINTNFHKDEYCCSEKCSINKKRERNIQKYGVMNVFQLDEVKDKSKNTSLKNYGVDHYMKLQSSIESLEKKMTDKYGYPYAIQVPEIKKRIENTNYVKYGVGNYFELIDRKAIYVNKRRDVLNYMKSKYPFIIDCVDSSLYKCLCTDCNNEFEVSSCYINNRMINNRKVCTFCDPPYSSNPEKEIESFLKLAGINFDKNNRSVCQPYEIDFLVGNTALEFNGIYWHSEFFKDKHYHLNKSIICSNKGIKLIHIWEDDWIYKKDIVKSIILHQFNMSTRIYARKCSIKNLSCKESSKFLEENHIQGSLKSKHNYGLFYKDELVSIMTFGKLRKSLGSNHEVGKWELLRFCNKKYTTVLGGASRLLNHFIRDQKPTLIVSYCDESRSTGSLYKNLSFSKISSTIDYYWCKNGIRYNRFIFRKDKLVKLGYDPKKTENEIMHELGYYKIYGCGISKWILNKDLNSNI